MHIRGPLFTFNVADPEPQSIPVRTAFLFKMYYIVDLDVHIFLEYSFLYDNEVHFCYTL
jgi:hypothetical protein